MNRGNNLQYGGGHHDGNNSHPSFGDMDSFLDLDMYQFTTNNTTSASSNNNLTRTTSSQPTAQPSFPYDLYQQTVPLPLPADFLPEITSGASSSMTMSPELLDMDAQLNAMMPPFFFPESMTTATVDPASILGGANASGLDMDFTKQQQVAPPPPQVAFIPQPAPQFDGKRLYAGIHTQRAAYNKDLENQRRLMAAQKKDSEGSPASSEMNLDDRINNILSRMKPNGSITSSEGGSPNSALPHIARMKKDEEEMDEDERLLASEEGKKLSSKERRQLRNKVSARAFRSRRKEYITQLEAEVAAKAAEATELRNENVTLKSEIAQLKEFTRNVLRSPAFTSFLADLEKGQGAVQAPANNNSNSASSQMQPPPPSDGNVFRKDPNPNTLNLVNDDWALAYGPVAGAPMWATNTPQVYAVWDLPSGPANLQELSGKPKKASVEEAFDWTSFPPPADGFRPAFVDGLQTVVEQRREEQMAEDGEDMYMDDVYDVEEEEDQQAPPESLEELYERKYERISDRIEALSPGVGLDALLGRLEKVINGEAEPAELFDGVERMEKEVAAEEETEETEEGRMRREWEERERCRDVARMFDAVETYKRIGSVVGV